MIAITPLLALVRRASTALRVASVACALALLCAAQAGGATIQAGQTGQSIVAPAEPLVATTLVQCVTTVAQTERSATFSGEMTAIPGTVRMVIRIDLEERTRGEALFHELSAPGLGVWRDSERKVKVYKSVQQVTNLSAPAVYRASVSFRWLNGKGHVIRRAERLTPKCAQPAAPAPVAAPTAETPPPPSPVSGT